MQIIPEIRAPPNKYPVFLVFVSRNAIQTPGREACATASPKRLCFLRNAKLPRTLQHTPPEYREICKTPVFICFFYILSVKYIFYFACGNHGYIYKRNIVKVFFHSLKIMMYHDYSFSHISQFFQNIYNRLIRIKRDL